MQTNPEKAVRVLESVRRQNQRSFESGSFTGLLQQKQVPPWFVMNQSLPGQQHQGTEGPLLQAQTLVSLERQGVEGGPLC